MNLPRDYYSLSELIALHTIWRNDLNHAIETGKLITSVVLGRCENASALISENASVPGYGSRPFYLDRDTAARIIQNKDYPLSYLFENLDEVSRSENDPEFLATRSITSEARITANRSSLVITTEAWERFVKEHSAGLTTPLTAVLPFPIIKSELEPSPASEPSIPAKTKGVLYEYLAALLAMYYSEDQLENPQQLAKEFRKDVIDKYEKTFDIKTLTRQFEVAAKKLPLKKD